MTLEILALSFPILLGNFKSSSKNGSGVGVFAACLLPSRDRGMFFEDEDWSSLILFSFFMGLAVNCLDEGSSFCC